MSHMYTHTYIYIYIYIYICIHVFRERERDHNIIYIVLCSPRLGQQGFHMGCTRPLKRESPEGGHLRGL